MGNRKIFCNRIEGERGEDSVAHWTRVDDLYIPGGAVPARELERGDPTVAVDVVRVGDGGVAQRIEGKRRVSGTGSRIDFFGRPDGISSPRHLESALRAARVVTDCGLAGRIGERRHVVVGTAAFDDLVRPGRAALAEDIELAPAMANCRFRGYSGA